MDRPWSVINLEAADSPLQLTNARIFGGINVIGGGAAAADGYAYFGAADTPANDTRIIGVDNIAANSSRCELMPEGGVVLDREGSGPGLHVVLAGTGARAQIYYREG